MTARPVHRRAAALAAGTAALLAVTAGVALAADQGDWQGGFTGWYPQNCLDRSAGVTYETGWQGPSLCMNSKYRDSDFQSERYGNLNAHPMNDHVLDFRNNFSTLWIQAFHHTNYSTPSTCIGGGTIIGPYPIGVSMGLSSFRSC